VVRRRQKKIGKLEFDMPTYILDNKFEFLTHECGGVDTIPTPVRWMVGEMRSISVSSPATFSEVSAIMSDKSTGK
jgi:hypothetical protein